MNDIKVKFCGLKSVDDVKNAVHLNCHSIGFVFVPKSKRYIEAEQAQYIVQTLKVELAESKVNTVALFADQSKEFIDQVLKVFTPDILQFHGKESASFCNAFAIPYWKAIPMLDDLDCEQYMSKYPSAEAFLLDSYGVDSMGGSGKSFQWFKFPKTDAKYLILAGGLNAENVKQALTETHANYVDVSSGIESSAGVKSALKMKQFMQQIKQYDN